MKLSPLAKAEWITALLTGVMVSFGVLALDLWWLALITVPLTVFAVTFFRDPDRTPPTQRGVAVAPADGRVVSIHDVANFQPFAGKPAVCVRIFLSIFNVHVQRTPIHGRVVSVTHKPGKHLNVLNPASVEQNESVVMVLQHHVKDHPVAAVRQIAGSFARTIVCDAQVGQVLQRAQRFGIIKLGSTVELYLPKDAVTRVCIGKGQKTIAGRTVIAEITQATKAETPEVPPEAAPEAAPEATTEALPLAASGPDSALPQPDVNGTPESGETSAHVNARQADAEAATTPTATPADADEGLKPQDADDAETSDADDDVTYVYVDEDGNEIDPQDVDPQASDDADGDWEYVTQDDETADLENPNENQNAKQNAKQNAEPADEENQDSETQDSETQDSETQALKTQHPETPSKQANGQDKKLGPLFTGDDAEDPPNNPRNGPRNGPRNDTPNIPPKASQRSPKKRPTRRNRRGKKK